jgi:hypothetical protein
MADLLTLNEYKTYAGIPLSDTTNDVQLAAMITAASRAIRNYTDRSFDTTLITEERQFEYDGGGYLDIDDATAITGVAFTYPLLGTTDITLDATYQWRAMPYGGPVYHYVIVPMGYYGMSPEMGFMRNLDVAAREGRLSGPLPLVKVTATWGWPAVPEDVKLATLWTLDDWDAGVAGPSNPGVVSESIEGYAVSYGSRQGTRESMLMAVSNRSKDLLSHYQKIYV